jgi:hypothetical protein
VPLDAVGSRELKGFGESVAVYALAAERSAAPEPAAASPGA